MLSKKLAMGITTVALVGLVGIGGTLAWFTDSSTANNVVTMGNVKIELTEPNFAPNVEGKNEVNNIVPGETIVKDPTITNIGNNDAYVRAQIEIKADDVVVENPGFEFDINEGWTKVGNYYYYNTELAAGAEPAVLFNNVKVPGAEWNNEKANASYEINVLAEAVQKDNFEDIFFADKDAPWGDVEILEAAPEVE